MVDVAIDEGLEIDEAAVVEDAERMLAALELDDCELSVLLTDDEGIRELNARWRQKDEPTDVLSFPQQEGEVVGGVLGDLVVSVPRAEAQAAEHGHDLRTELRVLLAHGLAHLLGHDHHDPDEAARMAEVERRLLAALALTPAGLVERSGVLG